MIRFSISRAQSVPSCSLSQRQRRPPLRFDPRVTDAARDGRRLASGRGISVPPAGGFDLASRVDRTRDIGKVGRVEISTRCQPNRNDTEEFNRSKTELKSSKVERIVSKVERLDRPTRVVTEVTYKYLTDGCSVKGAHESAYRSALGRHSSNVSNHERFISKVEQKTSKLEISFREG